jgi:hypothetical protein
MLSLIPGSDQGWGEEEVNEGHFLSGSVFKGSVRLIRISCVHHDTGMTEGAITALRHLIMDEPWPILLQPMAWNGPCFAALPPAPCCSPHGLFLFFFFSEHRWCQL